MEERDRPAGVGRDLVDTVTQREDPTSSFPLKPCESCTAKGIKVDHAGISNSQSQHPRAKGTSFVVTMGGYRGFGDKENGNNFAEVEGRDLRSLYQLIADNNRNPTQMMIYHAGCLQVFNSVTPEKAQAIIEIATAAEAAIDPAPEIMPRAPSSESYTHCIPAAKSPPLQMLQHTDGSDLICRLQTELPIARNSSLRRFLETRQKRLVNRACFTTMNVEDVPPCDGCSANGSSTSSSSFN